MTLGGLSNASGASFEMVGSASQKATLVFSAGGSGFTSNAGFFQFSENATVYHNTVFLECSPVRLRGTTMLTVTGAFTNSGALDLDIVGGTGGGSLTIGG